MLSTRNRHFEVELMPQSFWYSYADFIGGAAVSLGKSMLQNRDTYDWHNLAGGVRTLAEDLSDPAARNTMLELASRWERLSKAAEKSNTNSPSQ